MYLDLKNICFSNWPYLNIKIVSNPTSAILCFIVDVFISLLHWKCVDDDFPPCISRRCVPTSIYSYYFFFLNCAIYSTLRNYVYWYVCIYCRYNHKCFHIKIMHFIYIKKIQSYLSLNKTFTDYLPLMMKNKKFIYFELFQALNCFGEWHNLNVSTNYLWYFVIIKIFVKLFPKLQNFIELVFFLTFS